MATLQEQPTPEGSSIPALPTPEPSLDDVTKVDVGEKLMTLDDLGPMVVNSDGTLSRIANWKTMVPSERKRTLRVLCKRNRLRLADEELKLGSGSADQQQAERVSALNGSQ